MKRAEKSIEVLNDLIEINTERVAVFANAKRELDKNDNDLKVIFELLRDESRDNVYELCTAIKRNGIDKEINTDSTGALHRQWSDVKYTFAKNDRSSILKQFERGEKVMEKVYQYALSPENGLPEDLSEIIARQQQEILEAHGFMKSLFN